jgi:hypothetical protein
MAVMSKFPVIIGRSESIDLIDVALGIPMKVDTGAYRSAIHATNIQVKKDGDQEILSCNLLGHPVSPVVRPYETSEFRQVTVTNSFGQEEVRYETQFRVKLGPKIFNTSFTLADRSRNLFPVLAGRKMLRNRFIVDVSRSNIDRLRLKKDFNIDLPVDEEDLE